MWVMTFEHATGPSINKADRERRGNKVERRIEEIRDEGI